MTSKSLVAGFALLLYQSFLLTIWMTKSNMLPAYDATPKLQGGLQSQQLLSNHVQPNNYTLNNIEQYTQQHLPTCQEMMQKPHSPYANGAFLTRLTTNVEWRLRNDRSRELILPSTCQLKRYTSNEAKRCLNGKKLLFVGDSLTRYLYLSLAFFLEHDRWPDPFTRRYLCEFDKEACSKLEPNVCAEGDWGDWSTYLQSLGGSTDGGPFGGKMEITENRGLLSGGYEYVTSGSSTTLRFAAELGIGTEPYIGYNFSGCAKNGSCRYTSEMYDQKRKYLANETGFDWRYDNAEHFFSNGTDFLEQFADTDYAFYNRGLWGKLPKGKAETIMKSMYKITGGKQKPHGRCFYRSTTSCEKVSIADLGNHERRTIHEVANAANCEFLDYGHITEEFGLFQWKFPPPDRNIWDERQTVFTDSVHYHPWVYQELNNLLLNVLCNVNANNDLQYHLASQNLTR